MANDFYNASGAPADNSEVTSPTMRAEFAAIAAGFDKLPDMTANAYKLVYVNASSSGLDVIGGSGLVKLSMSGVPTVSKVALTEPATACTLTIADGKTLTASNSLTLAGTDSTTMTFPGTSASVARIDAAQTFVGTQTFSGLIAANLGLTVAGANFTSRGISDTATAVALTVSSSRVDIGGLLVVTDPGASAQLVVSNSGAGYAALSLTSASTNNIYVFFANAGGERARLTAADDNSLSVRTGVNTPQVRINHTASADRHITLTGSAGGNPTIGVSAGSVAVSSPMLNTSSAGVSGYGAGAGGTVTQLTSKSTAVTLNKPTGRITMHNQALAAGDSVGFQCNNSLVTTNDCVTVSPIANGNYRIQQHVANGYIGITVTNITAGSLSEALSLSFAVTKGATS